MKTKRIIQYRKLTKELKNIFKNLYGDGLEKAITKFKDPRDQSIHQAVSIETEDSYYLVIVDALLGRIYSKTADAENINFQIEHLGEAGEVYLNVE